MDRYFRSARVMRKKQGKSLGDEILNIDAVCHPWAVLPVASGLHYWNGPPRVSCTVGRFLQMVSGCNVIIASLDIFWFVENLHTEKPLVVGVMQ